MFAQQFDHSLNDLDLFNQYVNMDNSSVDGNKDVSFPGDLDQIFQLESLSSDCGEHSPAISTSTAQPHQQTAQNWSKDFWCLSQNADSSTNQGQNFSLQDTVHPSAVSDLGVNFEAPPTACAPETRPSPSTPPATPSRKTTKSAVTTPKVIRRHREPNDRRGPLHKQSFSPGITRSSQPQRNRMAYQEAWAQRFNNFSFRSSDERLPLSPPPSDILVQQENMAADNSAAHLNRTESLPKASAEMPPQYDTGIFNQSPAISMPSPSTAALAGQPPRYLSQSSGSGLPTSSPPSADDIFSSPHSSGPQSMSSWHSDSLGSSGIPYSTPDLSGQDGQAWWSPMASRVPQRQPSYQQMVASPAAQRPIQNSASQSDMLQGGLMIQLDPSSYDLSNTHSSFPSAGLPSAPNGHESRAYMQPTAAPVDSSSFVTPQIPSTHSRSPSLSPGSGSPKSGSMMHNGHRRSFQRQSMNRKLSSNSMSAPKPVKAPHSSSGSPKGGNKAVTVSFVNFTQNDSKRILTGVAPSGSSKTKARREQEARARRREISEAALQAVRSAGGDVEALEAILC
ncbi:hypothetical protein AtubIFM55763_007005 [Aspergillus tubingensis]|uniref:Developmental regulatory protein wetA n=3 Tax=Aspergillus subgen. Circumdati TaxID=2720871 RepID=A0A1L9NBI8_ASPTC|nr:hypothetical protein BO79DRAFT_279512 [Aspergillus costaricaensis CBS 115574]XP_035356699.1 developmental regulatory protein WetA [Aspergillus tubingensis]OJI86650.1 hypothetical protein ASPTUDRAFT_27661 [Aspergillus tubingensis CBS 134.48]RAK91380.1 hypothetical protein BO79DRAFT_279512 [Aspergillus costaricaensis CBS 115574]GFN15895.1 developmental regulatory protein WetA [Aspergillus tubingensis]GLA65875.1 hypothetical protein AtubIFM54640_008073 [Aspergillus tubingensis]GLA68806.1 hypo